MSFPIIFSSKRAQKLPGNRLLNRAKQWNQRLSDLEWPIYNANVNLFVRASGVWA
jgi:hypothetical protein